MDDTKRVYHNDNEIRQLVLDTMPIVIGIWDKNLNLIDSNAEAVRRYKLKSQQEYISRFHELSPEYQPCGTLSTKKAFDELAKALEYGYNRFAWIHQTLEGEIIPSDITCYQVKYKGEDAILTFNTDTREVEKYRSAEKAALKRMTYMFENTPLLIEYWDKYHNLVDVNPITLKYWGFNDLAQYKKQIYQHFIPKQPDGTPSKEFWKRQLDQTLVSGEGKWEFVISDPSNKTIYFDVKATRMDYDGQSIIATYSNDITDLKMSTQKALA